MNHFRRSGGSAGVVLCLVFAAASPSPEAQIVSDSLLWNEPGRPVAASLHETLRESGYQVTDVDGRALTEALRSGPAPHLLVLPYGGDYPAPAAAALLDFLESGGAVLAFGGNPLTQALVEIDGRWMPSERGASTLAVLALDREWSDGHAAAGVRLEMRPETPEAPARFVAQDFNGYAYIGSRMPALDTPDVVFVFEARDALATPRLCVELAANDGSRWKSVVPLSESWREYRLHIADFVSYNNDNRGADNDYCRADETRSLLFGFTSGMVGSGPRAFELRALRLEEAAVPGSLLKAHPRFKAPALSVRRWFGDPVGPETFFIAPFEPMPFVEGRAEDRIWKAPVFAPPTLSVSSGRLHERFAGATRAWSRVLLELSADDGRSVLVAGLTAFLAGPVQGGRHLLFNLPVESLDVSDLARDALTAGLDLLHKATFVAGVRPIYTLEEGAPRLSAEATLLYPSRSSPRVRVTARLLSADAVTDLGAYESVSDDRIQTARFAGGLSGLPVNGDGAPAPFRIEIGAADASDDAASSLRGETVFRMDSQTVFFEICEFLREHMDAHGRLHGNRFIDSRGARALLAAYEMTGDHRFRDTALRWTREKILDDQRDDGGYRMGYGIGPKGEECYVADGGEIAVCVAQAACYAAGEEREAFLRSLDRYMAYRESFRVETGGIGVGWCLWDYSQRPIVRLEEPTRIYAPEVNTYTIGCSLAAAYAHARLRDDPALFHRAAEDADWLMPRADTLNGAYIESFLYAHALTPSPERRALYADYIRRAFRESMIARASAHWWLTGGGRTALNLDGLAYWRARIAPDDAEAALAIRRAVAHMFSPDSPESIPSLIASSDALGHDDWIYVCYGTLGLADVLRPMITMEALTRTLDSPGLTQNPAIR